MFIVQSIVTQDGQKLREGTPKDPTLAVYRRFVVA